MVVVFVEEVPVCHPARDQLSDGFCDTCKKERVNTIEEQHSNIQVRWEDTLGRKVWMDKFKKSIKDV